MDLSFLAPIVDAFKAHAYGTCALAIVLAALNIAFRLKTPAQWVAILDGYPRVHALMDVVRAFVQPVELVNALYRAVTGKWPSDTPPGFAGSLRSTPPPANDVGPKAHMRTSLSVPVLLPFALIFAICLVLSSLTGCALLTPKRVNGTERIIECVIANRSLPPLQVAELCGAENADAVVDIITGEDKRVAAARVAACGPSAR